MRIQAYTLSEAYQIASQKLGISASDINIEVIKDGSSGFFGFFKKLGEYEAKATSRVKFKEHKEQKKEVKDFRKHKKEDFKNDARAENKGERAENKSEIKQERAEKSQKYEKKQENNVEPETKEELKTQPRAPRADAFKAFDSMIDTFNADKDKDEANFGGLENSENSAKPENSKTSANPENSKNSANLENSENSAQSEYEPKNSKNPKNSVENLVNLTPEILDEIKVKLSNLFAVSSFKIEVKEVSKYSDNDVFIRLDGEDCALLIGKEGYRYKALSYLLFNWLNSKYGISIRLEIAEFLKNQEAAVAAYLEGIIEKIEEQGFASTKVLDGVLLKIALEQLRTRFPNKYVGIKIAEDGKFIVINDFYKK